MQHPFDTRLMLDDLRMLVEIESPSSDFGACARCAAAVLELSERLLGPGGELFELEGRTHFRWRGSAPSQVALIGHFDTVWPLGTLERWPFAVRGDGTATGPGSFDMKAGIVQGFHALASVPDRSAIEVLLTSDEEVGSLTSRGLFEALAERVKAVLVLEPSQDGALKVARKGTGTYWLTAHGRASHAGLNPERGVNATVEMAEQVTRILALARPELGTTVTPTVISGGTAGNVVPALARLEIDTRALTLEEQARVDAGLRALAPVQAGASLTLETGSSRGPLEASASSDLFRRAVAVGRRLGMGELSGVTVGGGSDGNYTAAAGCPTLDGLGAVGDGAHAEGEHIVLSSLGERAALVSALVSDLLE